jgi:hypothetical protein
VQWYSRCRSRAWAYGASNDVTYKPTDLSYLSLNTSQPVFSIPLRQTAFSPFATLPKAPSCPDPNSDVAKRQEQDLQTNHHIWTCTKFSQCQRLLPPSQKKSPPSKPESPLSSLPSVPFHATFAHTPLLHDDIRQRPLHALHLPRLLRHAAHRPVPLP